MLNACQIHGDFFHQAPGHLRPTTSSWPFEMWGMGVVGPISPPSSKGHQFSLAITDYFSKWDEAIPLREVKTSDVIKFIKHQVVVDCLKITKDKLSENRIYIPDERLIITTRVMLRRRA